MLQKLKNTTFLVAALAILLSLGYVSTAVAVPAPDPGGSVVTPTTPPQAPGECFLHTSGAAVTHQKCQTMIGSAAGQKDTDGNPLDYKNCYIVTATSASMAITLADCSGNPTPTNKGTAGTVMCVGPNGEDAACDTISDPAANSGNCSNVNKCDLINNYINPFINFLAALVGVAVVISIIIGGIQYGSSAGDSQKVTAAKARIRNAIIALLMFLFLYALLNFLIPGGLV